ncbi:MAG: hypothetical protein Kow0089_07270 [Desulfobulbaceae bacterium]
MNGKLNTLAFGSAGAIVAGISMIVLSLAGRMGMYMGGVEMMGRWHMFYSLTPMGIIGGVIEAAAISFVFFALFSWVYNLLTGNGGGK